VGLESIFTKLRLFVDARRWALALLPILFVAALVRVPGIRQNLPFVFLRDEPTTVSLASWFFTEGSLNPRFFDCPGGMVYALGLLYVLTILGGMLSGHFHSWGAGVGVLTAGAASRPPGGGIAEHIPVRGAPVAYIVGRLFSVVLGLLTVWWVARMAGRLAGRRAAWLAGGFLALNAVHAAGSVLVTPEVACGAFLAWFLLGLSGGRSPRAAGIALGLAAACDYFGAVGIYLWPLGLLVTPILGTDGPTGGDAAASAGHDAAHRRAAWNRYWRRLLPWAGGTFVLLNPFAFLSPGALLRGMAHAMGYGNASAESLGETARAASTGLAVVAGTLWRGLGPFVLIAILLALLLAVPARRRAQAADATAGDSPEQLDQRWISLLAAWCVVGLLQLCTWKVVHPRSLLPLWPAASVLAGCGASMAAEQVLREQGVARVRSARRMALIAAAVLLAGPGLYPLGRSIAARLRTDPRVPMSVFLAATVRPGEGIGAESGGPWISEASAPVVQVDFLGRSGPDGWRRQGVRYLLASGREAFLSGDDSDSLRANLERIGKETHLLWQQGRYAVYDLGRGPGSAEGVRALLAAGQMQEADQRARALWDADPTSVAAAILVGDVLMARQDTAGAFDAYGRAAGLAPRDPSPLLAIGTAALSGHSWDAAIEAYSLAVDRAPGNPTALHGLAIALLERAGATAASGNRLACAADLRDAARYARTAVGIAPEDGRLRETEARARAMAARFGVRLDR
jgi:hypothetical protein